MVLSDFCKKIIFMPTNVIGGYVLTLFLLLVISEQLPFPKTFLSSSDNFFNVYFAKVCYFWTLIVTLPFILLTSIVYCCGKWAQIWKHLARLIVAAGFFFFLYKFKAYVKSNVGSCIGRDASKEVAKLNKFDCISQKFIWRDFNISSHVISLVYSISILVEESKVIKVWEGLEDFIRSEDHSRQSKNRNGALYNLSPEEFDCVKLSYNKFTGYVRSLFICMTVFVVFWHIMLIVTIIYFHDVSEKLLGALIGVGSWFITYKVWFAYSHVLPYSPIEGDFKSFGGTVNVVPPSLQTRDNGVNKKGEQIPIFPRMPLYGLQTQATTQQNESQSGS